MKVISALSGILLQTEGLASGVVADKRLMFASDKIYTVMIVILIIWTGILLALFFTGRKVMKLEKEVEQLRAGQKQGTPRKS
jgi:CcmD family protein